MANIIGGILFIIFVGGFLFFAIFMIVMDIKEAIYTYRYTNRFNKMFDDINELQNKLNENK